MLFLYLSVTGLYSQNKAFSRWSIWAEYGYNYLDGDINQNLTSVFPNSLRETTYGGGIEYALSPVWGLSLNYNYFPLKATNQIPFPVNIETIMHSGTVNATINFTRLIFPETRSKFYFNGGVGLGFANYTFFATDPATGLKSKHILPDTIGPHVANAGAIPVFFSGEYNFSRPVSAGFKVQYIAYTKDNLEGVQKLSSSGVTNDYVATAALFLRYKFRSISKNHARNIRWQDYAPDLGLSTALEAKREIAALTAKVNTVDKKVGEIDTKVTEIDGKLNSLTPRIENLEKFISNDGPDTDNDGVPDVRDRDNNTPANTPVDFWGQTARAIPVENSKKQTVEVPAEIPSVYFDYDSYQLDEAAIIAISKAAMRMLADSTLIMEVRGYTDFSGNENYNLRLSQKRAERVKKELVKVWEISEKRIIANPKGRLPKPQKAYRPNRRCDFYFSK